MRILYVSHRYHTNQNEIIHGWQEHGDEVAFFTQYQGKIEDYTYIHPEVLGYSKGFLWFNNLWVNHIRKKDPFAKDMRLRYGVPPRKKAEEMIRAFHPDLVILRERSLYTVVLYRICRKYHYRTFLYNLSPVYAEPGYYSHNLPHRIMRKLTPEYRLTPTHQIGIDMTGKIRDEHSYFAPFLVPLRLAPEEKHYFQDGLIHILEIGKYQDRKNHFMMVNAFRRIHERYPGARLTICGEVSDHFQSEYYEKLSLYVKEQGLSDLVTLKQNQTKEQMGEEYRRTDLYVLSSTGEPASITVIEAMAWSVPAISGTDNGTCDYIEPGVTGEVFADNDEDDLVRKMESILSDRDRIPEMGQNGYRSIIEKFSFHNYYETIQEMIRDQDAHINGLESE